MQEIQYTRCHSHPTNPRVHQQQVQGDVQEEVHASDSLLKEDPADADTLLQDLQ